MRLTTPWVCVAATARQMPDCNGVCDDEEVCVGTYDECGVMQRLTTRIKAQECADENACNYAGSDVGRWLYACILDALGVCGGDCAADADGDGVCDDVEDCVGAYDACGVNATAPTTASSAAVKTVPVGDCDCNGQRELDALGV